MWLFLVCNVFVILVSHILLFIAILLLFCRLSDILAELQAESKRLRSTSSGSPPLVTRRSVRKMSNNVDMTLLTLTNEDRKKTARRSHTADEIKSSKKRVSL